MNNKPICVFDSGLGGLTAVKQLMKKMPDERIVYFGDTGRVPYGTRSRETLIRYTGDQRAQSLIRWISKAMPDGSKRRKGLVMNVFGRLSGKGKGK